MSNDVELSAEMIALKFRKAFDFLRKKKKETRHLLRWDETTIWDCSGFNRRSKTAHR